MKLMNCSEVWCHYPLEAISRVIVTIRRRNLNQLFELLLGTYFLRIRLQVRNALFNMPNYSKTSNSCYLNAMKAKSKDTPHR